MRNIVTGLYSFRATLLAMLLFVALSAVGAPDEPLQIGDWKIPPVLVRIVEAGCVVTALLANRKKERRETAEAAAVSAARPVLDGQGAVKGAVDILATQIQGLVTELSAANARALQDRRDIHEAFVRVHSRIDDSEGLRREIVQRVAKIEGWKEAADKGLPFPTR